MPRHGFTALRSVARGTKNGLTKQPFYCSARGRIKWNLGAGTTLGGAWTRIAGVYSAVLSIHSWLRWATLLMAVAATVNAFRTPAAGAARLPGRWWDTCFMLAVDLQVLFGLVLYFGLSPFTTRAMENFPAALENPAMRFWAVEHAGVMLIAVVLVRMGRVLALNAATPAAGRRRRLICFA